MQKHSILRKEFQLIARFLLPIIIFLRSSSRNNRLGIHSSSFTCFGKCSSLRPFTETYDQTVQGNTLLTS